MLTIAAIFIAAMWRAIAFIATAAAAAAALPIAAGLVT
jgi:hypothetical protein